MHCNDAKMTRKRVKIILALGSNTDQEYYMAKAIECLKKSFVNIAFSEKLWTRALEIESDRFLNMLAIATTTQSIARVRLALKEIERKCGRTKGDAKCNIVKMDVDLLKYGEEKYHLDDWERQYVKQLLAQIGGER